jgi:hypothetical protein
MTISRRSFARSIIAALAGATVLRQAVATPVEAAAVTECHGVPVNLVPEGPRTIFDHEAFNEWKSYSLQPRRLSVSINVSRELLEDSPLSVSTIIQSRLALALAKTVVDWWGKGAEYTVSTICDVDLDLDNLWITYTHIATEDKDYRMQRLRDEWRRMHVGPKNVTTLPEGWKCGSYATADEWHSLPRGRFDYALDDQKAPR